MNAADSEIRSRYLALALDARKIVDVLIRFVESEQRHPSLDKAVNEAIEALTSVTKGLGGVQVHSGLAFEEYEQVLTIDEVRSSDDLKTVISDLARIIAPEGKEALQAAMRVLEFFFAVESRALQYYNRPPVMAAY